MLMLLLSSLEQLSLNLMMSLIQFTAESLLDGSNGHPHKTRESLASYLDFTSKQLVSSANGLTTMSSSKNDLWSESYLVFS